MMMKPALLEIYEKHIASGKFSPNENQKKLITILDNLSLQLVKHSKKNIFSLKSTVSPKGLYILGEVGRGKTWLMDLFYHHISISQKKRIHFHAFMKNIHEQLTKRQGQKNPLNNIAKELSKTVKLLCLDEFFVKDIADAMILSNLLHALFINNITIVLTSNSSLDELYYNGLQRDQFLPAISLIKKNMEIFTLNSEHDYRYLTHHSSYVFFNTQHEVKLSNLFLKLADNTTNIQYNTRLFIYDKPIEVKALSDNIIWFDFTELCAIPRSQNDYISIANRFKIIIIDNLDKIDENDLNIAAYFIKLIDILYDSKNLLIISSAVDIQNIYPNGILRTEFQRTESRLTEMQSLSYIEQTKERILCKLKSS